MKKSLLMLGAAAMMLASCTQNEVVEVAESRAIGFDAFVGNTTKADITDANIREFYVYGGYDNNLTNVFNNVKVSSTDGSNWTYTNTQYWTASKTYKFQGYAPENATASAGENGVNFTNFVADGTTDLLASAVETKTIDATISNSSDIQLTFRHVLSKIKFKFTTDLANVNISISALTVKSLPNKGTYTNNGATGSTWNVSESGDYALTSDGTLTNSAALTSGDAIVLPQTPNNISVTFTVTATGGLSLTTNHTVTLPATKLEEGNVYVYTAAITYANIDPNGELKPITFGDPTVNPWSADQTGGDVTFN